MAIHKPLLQVISEDTHKPLNNVHAQTSSTSHQRWHTSTRVSIWDCVHTNPRMKMHGDIIHKPLLERTQQICTNPFKSPKRTQTDTPNPHTHKSHPPIHHWHKLPERTKRVNHKTHTTDKTRTDPPYPPTYKTHTSYLRGRTHTHPAHTHGYTTPKQHHASVALTGVLKQVLNKSTFKTTYK